jgi:tRNA (guanine-N7-)-methyltransferase
VRRRVSAQGVPVAESTSSTGSTRPIRSLIYAPDSYVERIDLARVFATEQPLEVELGSGDGGFILRWAALHPERNLLAVERLKGRLSKIERKGGRLGLRNLRGMRIEAGYFLEYLLPRSCATTLHVYFPDPWPKRKHRQYRLINAHFVQVAAAVLRPRGRVYLRTDDADYFGQMTEVFGANAAFIAVDTPADLAGVQTDFELEFLAKGVGCRRAAYELAAKGS